MTCDVIVVAGGAGLRADPENSGRPKQYRLLAGQPVIARSLGTFLSHPQVRRIQVVLRAGTEGAFHAAVPPHPGLAVPVIGGAERQDSVRIGLEALEAASPDFVLIHDAVRPFVTAGLVGRVLAALDSHDAAIPAVAVTDTLKRGTPSGMVEATVERANLFAAQTPQGFRFDKILAAHRKVGRAGLSFTDDSSIAEWAGFEAAIVAGDVANRKLTTQEDFALADAQLGRYETRFGTGFDVHRFGPGDHFMMCGVPVAYGRGLSGHSDADVGLHALTDALLGTVADGDIGAHFPPSDPVWAGQDSAVFLEHARNRIAAAGGRIVNADVTVICEMPKIAPYRDTMRSRVAGILGIDVERVSVKATTTEGLGFAGRGEGIAAQAAVAVEFSRDGGAY
jgi:2-C-methyl-D-erythritol 4-phosphate cytidylyltransferase / 2-C-methyl-D-erythritol 2,4-cyclodiphosphate synthase